MEDLESTIVLMAKIAACWSPSFSVDGENLAFISNMNGIPQVYMVPITGGWPKLITNTQDQINDVICSPTDNLLAFSLAPGGGMNEQIYLTDFHGLNTTRITAGGNVNNWLINWSYDGTKILFSSNQRAPEVMDAYLYDISRASSDLIVKDKGVGYFTDISRDNKYALLMRMLNRSNNNLFLIDIETKEEILLTPHEGFGSFDNAKFSPDMKVIYLSSNKDRDMVTFSRIELDNKSDPGIIRDLIEKPMELERFNISMDGKYGLLVWNEGGKNTLELYCLHPFEKISNIAIPAEIVSTIVFSNTNQLAMTLNGSTSPYDIWAYNISDEKLWQVTYSPHAGVALETLVKPSLVHFSAHDNLGLSGWLYVPRGFYAPGPVVLSFHGGPEAQERPGFNYYFQALLSQGIAVFAPNVRGSAGFGKSFVNLDNGPLRFNAIKDIKSCVDYLTTSKTADKKRVAIMGGSYGGYMTMAGLTEYPNLFAAGANLYGIVNFETFFENTEPWMAEISKIQYGDPKTQRDLLKKLSPIHKIDRIKAATIVLHGQNDTNCPVIEAEQVVNNLKKRNVPVKFVLFPDEGHGFAKTKNKITAITEITKWLKEYL